MQRSPVRIMVVEDHAIWSQFVRSMLHNRNGFRVVCEVSDGLEATLKAGELKPDMIVLDIGLPSLNGIEAARRIACLAPQSKILFLSENRDVEVVREAMSTGARGYVFKSQAATELLPAVESVLGGGTFRSEPFRLAASHELDPLDRA